MTPAAAMPTLTYQGQALEADHLQIMKDSSPLLGDVGTLRQRMSEDGYLYLPGMLGRERVLRARRVILERLAKYNLLDPAADLDDAIAHPANRSNFAGGRLDELFDDPNPIEDVLYRGPMMDFFRAFLAAEVLHYDFTWMRQVPPGPATGIHSDVVYMGRGTHQLYTAWTPMGDNSFDLGGLLVLEGSHKHEGLRKAYWQSDVDAFCVNRADQRDGWAKGHDGGLKGSAQQLRRSLGGTWRTADYRAGDVVIFNVYTVHGGTDNRSNRMRLSTDTRYQRAGDAVDERWVGEKPVGHGPGGKRGKIC